MGNKFEVTIPTDYAGYEFIRVDIYAKNFAEAVKKSLKKKKPFLAENSTIIVKAVKKVNGKFADDRLYYVTLGKRRGFIKMSKIPEVF